MDKLKGSGSTFSTAGKSWRPFRFNPMVAAQNAKRHRLVRKGLTGHETKAEMRELANKLRQGRETISDHRNTQSDQGNSR